MYFNLTMHQLICGTSTSIMEDPATPIAYLEPGIFTNMRSFLATAQCTIHIPKAIPTAFTSWTFLFAATTLTTNSNT